MNQDICSAIKSRRVLHFYYGGGYRRAEPFCYGVSRANNEVLRAYQVGGYSGSGNAVGWKLFEVGEMSNIEITDEQFNGARSGYNPNDLHMKQIYCCV